MPIISVPLADSPGKLSPTNVARSTHQKECKSRREKGCPRVLFLDTAALHYFRNSFLLCTLNFFYWEYFKIPFQSLFLCSSLVGHF